MTRKNIDKTHAGGSDVSMRGALDLKDGSAIMNGWQATVKKCVNSGKVQARTNTIVLDYESHTNKYVVLECTPDAVVWDYSGLFLSLHDPANKCNEICHDSR